MKKILSLGKALTKDEQRRINGGMLTVRQATCNCADGWIEYACGPTCQDAINACFSPSVCVKHGGTETSLITCTACS